MRSFLITGGVCFGVLLTYSICVVTTSMEV